MCVPDDSPYLEAYAGRTSVVLGVLVIVLQVIAVGLNILSLFFIVPSGFLPNLFTLAQPAALSAIPIILFGAFAIAAGKSKKRCLIITHMVFAIIAACFAILFICIATVGLIFDASQAGGSNYRRERVGSVVLAACLVAVALFQFVVAIVCAVLCGRVICCTEPTTDANFIVLTTTPPDNKY